MDIIFLVMIAELFLGGIGNFHKPCRVFMEATFVCSPGVGEFLVPMSSEFQELFAEGREPCVHEFENSFFRLGGVDNEPFSGRFCV